MSPFPAVLVPTATSLRPHPAACSCGESALADGSPNSKASVAREQYRVHPGRHSRPDIGIFWRGDSGEVPAKTLERLRHGERLTTATLSSDGKLVVTASWDGTARVWDLRDSSNDVVLRATSIESPPPRSVRMTDMW